MYVFELIGRVIFNLLKQAWLLPQSIGVVFQGKRRAALLLSETERLDRIRNPTKYLGR
jgi:hypothetical protein